MKLHHGQTSLELAKPHYKISYITAIRNASITNKTKELRPAQANASLEDGQKVNDRYLSCYWFTEHNIYACWFQLIPKINIQVW